MNIDINDLLVIIGELEVNRRLLLKRIEGLEAQLAEKEVEPE